MTLGDTASAVGRGLFAGAVGTAAMTVSSTIEAKLRERAASTAPADAAGKVLGVKPIDDAGQARFSNVVHWTYGTSWGAVRGLLHAAGVDGLEATALHFGAIWGSEQLMLPALGVAPPLWKWGQQEILIDALHHAVYVAATSLAFAALEHSASGSTPPRLASVRAGPDPSTKESVAMSDAAVRSTRGACPRQAAPELRVELLDGATFVLADQTPERFTMIVFFRGLHCPVCQAQLRELNRRVDEITDRGITVIAVSSETRARTQQLNDEWQLERLQLAFGLTEPAMRAWGLFLSRGITDREPALFNEPGLFLVTPDTAVYYASLLSMPVGRPRLDELLDGIDYWTANDYPARGEA